MSRISHRLWTHLNRPLFGTRTVPSQARVDPDLFSEEEFPLFCPACDYLLRGIPDGPCPECGREFERGRLLVNQYVHDWTRRIWRTDSWGRVAVGIAIVAAVVIFTLNAAVAAVGLLGPWMLNNFGRNYALLSRAHALPQTFNTLSTFISVLLLLGLVGALLLCARAFRRAYRKRLLVIACITDPAAAGDSTSPVSGSITSASAPEV